MRRGALLSAALLACAVPAAAQDPAEPARADIYATVDAFHSFLELGDSTAAIAMLDPEVTIFESGHAETLEQYRGGHLYDDIAFAQGVESTVLEEWAGFDPRQALVGRVYAVKGTFGDREIDAVTAETMFLLRTPGGSWRIRHIHWSSRTREHPDAEEAPSAAEEAPPPAEEAPPAADAPAEPQE